LAEAIFRCSVKYLCFVALKKCLIFITSVLLVLCIGQ